MKTESSQAQVNRIRITMLGGGRVKVEAIKKNHTYGESEVFSSALSALVFIVKELSK